MDQVDIDLLAEDGFVIKKENPLTIVSEKLNAEATGVAALYVLYWIKYGNKDQPIYGKMIEKLYEKMQDIEERIDDIESDVEDLEIES